MKNINILIKPASQRCNIDCKYCFYHDIANNRETPDFGFMKEDTYKAIIDKCIEYVESGSIGFAFQGGEPTLVGVGFYQQFIAYVKQKNVGNKIKVKYSIQTNGILLTDRFCEMLKANNFLVGLSLDGTKKLNDINRIDYQNKGTFDLVLKASDKLNKFQIPFNILTVISNTNVYEIASIYQFYQKQGYKYIQFIACIDSIEEKGNKYALTKKEYTKYLFDVFDGYYQILMNNQFISERFMDNVLGMYLKQEPESCMQKGFCSLQFVVEGSGEVFPCDFYAFDEYSMGNFKTHSLKEMIDSDCSKQFIGESMAIHPKCRACKFLNICRGGCKRFQKNDVLGNNLNIYCESLYEFFEYAHPKFCELAQVLVKRKMDIKHNVESSGVK